MGHWEQIGRDNAEERERKALQPAWRKELSRQAQLALVAAGWLVLALFCVQIISRLAASVPAQL